MGKSNFDDEEIELKCNNNEENQSKDKSSSYLEFINNSTTNDTIGDEHIELSSHDLLADSLQIKQTFKEIDLNDKSTIDEETNGMIDNRPNNDIDSNKLADDCQESIIPVQSVSPNILSGDHAYQNQNEILKNSIKLFKNEFKRLGFNEKYWRYTSSNKNFTICSTYPPYFIIPTQFIDDDLAEVAKFRHMGLLPTVVYRHRNGAVIVRSSQPSVGLLSRRSTEDEKLLQQIFSNCIQDQSELIEKNNSSFEDTNGSCDCLTPKLNGHQVEISVNTNGDISNNNLETSEQSSSSPSLPNEKYCQSHSQEVVNSKNCQPSTQSSKFFSLSDKILENIMSYTSYNEVASVQQNSTADNSLTNKKLLILDARSFTAAFGNRVFGGGSECSEYYPNCEVDYLYLANIHAVRTAFFSLKTLIRSNDNSQYNPPNNNYFTNWSKSNSNYWLYYISNLIESALKIVQAIGRDARPVLIHCSDGWDRTSQIVSLAELILDPFYRTIQGFRVLLQREWLDFGHKFADRCGVQPVSKNVNERSPIFIQWLDCVYQIIQQCPDYFEFNCTYLEELAFHTYSPLFGTFSCNSYLERLINQIHGETTSVWSYLEKSKVKFINENYIESTKVLELSYSVSDMSLWRELYQKLVTEDFESRFDMKNATQNLIPKNQLIDVNNQRKKKLSRTNSFTSNSSQSLSSYKNRSINLRKTKSDSNLLASFKRSVLKNSSDGQTTPNYNNNQNGGTNIETSDQLRNGNFQLNDQRLDPQPSFYKSNYEMTKSNSSLNGKHVMARIAQLANSNQNSNLMMSVLTYMNSYNHTFSVK